MTVGEFSSPFLKGPQGKFVPGTGDIFKAIQAIRNALDQEGITIEINMV
jgi:hypothetical protein